MKRFARNQMGKIDAFVPRKRFMWDKAATYKEIPGISAGPSSILLLLLDIISDQQTGRRKNIDMTEAL